MSEDTGGWQHCNMKLLGVTTIGLLVLNNNVQGKASKRSSHRDDRMADFDIGDLADLSSIPGYGQGRADTRDVKMDSDLDMEEEEGMGDINACFGKY